MTMTIQRLKLNLPTVFLLGWVTYVFALFNVGRFSITLLLVVSLLLAILWWNTSKLFSVPAVCLLSSGLLAWSIAFLSYAEIGKTFTHLTQYLIAIGVMIGGQTIDWDSAFPKFRKAIFWIAGIVLVYGAYQFVARKHGLPFAFLQMSNLQIAPDDGFQRGAMYYTRGTSTFTRVSSFFAEPSDLGRFMMWVFAVGYASNKAAFKLVLMGMGIAGILISQSMGGVVGLLFLVFVVTILKRSVRRTFLFIFIGAVMLTTLHGFYPQAFKTLETRAILIVTEREGHLIQSGRFADAADNLRLFLEAPLLGYGLGSIKKVAPTNKVASAWELLLIERGIVGTLLFITPFFWVFLRLAMWGGTSNEIQNTALMILIVELYCFSTFAMLYFPPIYLALGFALYFSAGSRIGKKWSNS